MVRLDRFSNSLGTTQHFVLRSEHREYPKLIESRLSAADARSATAGAPINLHCVPKMLDVPVDNAELKHYLVALDGNLDPQDVYHG